MLRPFVKLIPDPGAIRPFIQAVPPTFSTLGYFGVIGLSISSVYHLRRKERVYSTPMQIFLFTYIILMFLLSTVATVQEYIYASKTLPTATNVPGVTSQSATLFNLFDVPISLPFTIWGADMFMIWRCAMLYQGVSRGPQILVNSLLICISLVSLGGGIFFFLQPIFAILNGVIFVAILTTSANIILSLLIGLRILYHERLLRNLLGVKYGSPYKRVLTIVVESCALIVAFGVMFIVLYYTTSNTFVLPLAVLPHICVISPLLVISRVARGRSATTMVGMSQVLTPNISAADASAIHFNHSTSFETRSINTNIESLT